MKNILNYNIGQNIIAELCSYIYKNNEKDYSKTAVVFGGKRPSLFLKKELSKKINSSFFPPRMFSIEEFVLYILKNIF